MPRNDLKFSPSCCFHRVRRRMSHKFLQPAPPYRPVLPFYRPRLPTSLPSRSHPWPQPCLWATEMPARSIRPSSSPAEVLRLLKPAWSRRQKCALKTTGTAPTGPKPISAGRGWILAPSMVPPWTGWRLNLITHLYYRTAGLHVDGASVQRLRRLSGSTQYAHE